MNYLLPLAIIFISRLIFLSPWLEDWDSVQFSFALHDFDLGKNQPHAPGYILYIILGKILYFFSGSDLGSLNILSAIAGTLACLFIYLIAKSIFTKKVGIISAIIFAIAPISWMMSVTPLTNMVGLASFLVLAYLLYNHFSSKPLLISLFAGFILGFRATELPMILSLVALSVIKHKKLTQVPRILGWFVIGICLWIVPTVLATGLNSFLSAYQWIANYVIKHDSVATQMLNDRLQKIGFLLDVSFTKIFVLAVIIVFFVILVKKLYKRYAFQFLLVWLASYLIPLIFVYNLEVPRYALPLLPPAVIILSYFLARKYLLLILLIGILIAQSFSQLTRFQNSTPPSIASVIYIKENLIPADTLILASYTYRQFEYYASEYQSYYNAKISEQLLADKKYTVLDYKGLVDQLPKGVEYKIVNQINFAGDIDIYSRLPKVTLYILEINYGQKN